MASESPPAAVKGWEVSEERWKNHVDGTGIELILVWCIRVPHLVWSTSKSPWLFEKPDTANSGAQSSIANYRQRERTGRQLLPFPAW